MTGVVLPASMRSRTTVKSLWLGFARTMTSFWLTNRDNTGAVIARVEEGRGQIVGGEIVYKRW